MKKTISLFLTVLLVWAMLPMLPAVTKTADAATVTFNGIDTLMIYNPLIFYDYYSNGWTEQVNGLSTGNMSGQISTTAGSVRALPQSREFNPISSAQVREMLGGVGEKGDFSNSHAEESKREQTRYVVSDTRDFFLQPDLNTTNTTTKTTMTCRAVGEHCYVWGNSNFTNTTLAQDMANEFDNTVYDADVNNFASARYVEDGEKLNILVYNTSNGVLGFFWGTELYTADELGTYASSYNHDSAIIHLNAQYCSTYYISECYVTMAHEFQHLINFTSTLKNPANYNGDTMGTWLNESMSMQAEELIYPGEVAAQGYISGSYNGSSLVAGGQSLYCFDTSSSDIGVYGQVFLFSEYIKKQTGTANVFKSLHSNWRSCAASLLNDGANLENAFSTLNPATMAEVNNSVNYSSALINQINDTDNSSDTTADSVSVFISKLNVNFQIATYLREQNGLHAMTATCSGSNPKLNTSTSVSIDGGGRIWVKTLNGTSYTVPADASEYLIYTGFSNGELVFGPVMAADYTESTDPEARINPQTASINVGQSFTANITSFNFTPNSFTWSSSDANVASVNGNGSSATVKGLSDGTSTITCVVTDGTNSFTLNCAVTVTTYDGDIWVLTDTIEAGTEYLICQELDNKTFIMSGTTIRVGADDYLVSNTVKTGTLGAYNGTDDSTEVVTSLTDGTAISNLYMWSFSAVPTADTFAYIRNSNTSCYLQRYATGAYADLYATSTTYSAAKHMQWYYTASGALRCTFNDVRYVTANSDNYFNSATTEKAVKLYKLYEAPANEYSVNYSQAANGTLSVSVNDTPLTSGSKVASGTVIDITATPNAGYELTTLTANGTSLVPNDYSASYTVESDTTLAVGFSLAEYTVSWDDTVLNGTLSVTLGGTEIENGTAVAYGTELVVTATPDEWYEVGKMSFNGEGFDNGDTITIIDDTVIEYEFDEIASAIISWTAPEGGAVSVQYPAGTAVTSGTRVPVGAEVTITVTPDIHHVLYYLRVDGVDVKPGDTYTIVADAEITFSLALLGDVDKNGTIDVGDAALIMRAIVNLVVFDEYQELVANVSGNEVLSVQDASLLLQRVVGIINSFPVAERNSTI